ncbi:hypothetical protein LTR37_011697 [Vermiconidia calcicola]|uniref:Uncharacterized protein n=1 Tax=Vermiconidia calcicola TaxID=1690605 RepID=A0ACC3N1S0_9PEZI|nr:hypothetical protein LTR37_011697 [Vermiconidia calcicola]
MAFPVIDLTSSDEIEEYVPLTNQIQSARYLHIDRLKPYFDRPTSERLEALPASNHALSTHNEAWKTICTQSTGKGSSGSTTVSAVCQVGPYKGVGVLDWVGTDDLCLVNWVPKAQPSPTSTQTAATTIRPILVAEIKGVAIIEVEDVALWLKFEVGDVTHEFALEWSQYKLTLYCVELVKQRMFKHDPALKPPPREKKDKKDRKAKKTKARKLKKKTDTAQSPQNHNTSAPSSFTSASPAIPPLRISPSSEKPKEHEQTTAIEGPTVATTRLVEPLPDTPTSTSRAAEEYADDEETTGVPGGTPMCVCCVKNPLISERELETGYCDDAECGAKCSNCGALIIGTSCTRCEGAFPDQGSEAGDGGDNEHDENYVDGKD